MKSWKRNRKAGQIIRLRLGLLSEGSKDGNSEARLNAFLSLIKIYSGNFFLRFPFILILFKGSLKVKLI